ncbi:hypothetical protein BDW62DRAFT_202194 [Aspergillus aurantiobrunneus]
MKEHGNIKILRQYIQELYVVVFEVFTDLFTKITLEFQRQTTRSLEKLVSDQEKLLALFPQQLEHQRYLLGASIQKFLGEQLQSAQPLSEPSFTLALGSGRQSPQLLAVGQDADPTPVILGDYHRAELTSAVPEYLDQFRLEMRELVKMSQISSKNLWIQGPHGAAKPSQNCMTAVSIVALSHGNSIPTVSYFCSLSHDIHAHPTRDDALRAMLTSIVAQLVLFLPERGSTSMDLSLARFSAIAQNAPSVDELLRMIRDLRRAGPRYVHCVIDSTLCNLAYSIHEDNDNQGLGESPRITKTCLTTDGMMDVLSQAAEIDLVEKIEFGVEADDGITGDSTYMGF